MAELLYVISREISIGRITIKGTFNWVGILAGFQTLTHVGKISISEVSFTALKFIVLKTRGIYFIAAGIVGSVTVALSRRIRLYFFTFCAISASGGQLIQ